MEAFTVILLFVFLLFVIIAYMVLVRDIWTPIVKYILQIKLDGSSESGGNAVLLIILLLICPFLLKKDLHALRHNCYVGFTSILVLCLAMVKRAHDRMLSSQDLGADRIDSLKFTSSNFSDILFAFPIITLSFLSSFNVISVHAALIDPTRKRVRMVIDSAVFSCFALMYIFGLAGYLYAGRAVRGNILLNFPFDDHLVLIGRVGSGITIALALPIMLLPCREAFFDIITHLSLITNNTAHQNLTNMGEQSPLLEKIHQPIEMLSNTNFINISTTISIITLCFICAAFAPGVATVWSICGSSMAFFIAFTLPTAFYIQIRSGRKGHWNKRILLSWFIFIFSILGAFACTIQVIWRMFYSNSNID